MNVVLRETWRGRVWRAVACRVVEEHDDLLVLWHPEGTTVKRPFDLAGRELRIPGEGHWRLENRPSANEALGLKRPGSRYSLWLNWRDGRFLNWYVNFETAFERTPIGFDHVDE